MSVFLVVPHTRYKLGKALQDAHFPVIKRFTQGILQTKICMAGRCKWCGGIAPRRHPGRSCERSSLWNRHILPDVLVAIFGFSDARDTESGGCGRLHASDVTPMVNFPQFPCQNDHLSNFWCTLTTGRSPSTLR